MDNSGNQTGGSQETEVKPVLPGREGIMKYFYDKETGKFKVTFNIKEDAKGDQTIELSKVMEEINAAGKKQFEQWFQTKEGAGRAEKMHSITDKIRSVRFSMELNIAII